MKYFVVALITAAVSAVSTQHKTKHGNAGQTQTLFDYGVEDLNGLQDTVDSWFKSVAKPFLNQHRNLVRDVALAELQDERGQLLATCDEGTTCRKENETKIKEQMNREWSEVMKSFRKDVTTSILRSKEIVAAGWDTAVQCEVDHSCCTVSETVWNNLQIQISQTETLISEKKSNLHELECQRHDLETKCDQVDFEEEVGKKYTEPICSLHAAVEEEESVSEDSEDELEFEAPIVEEPEVEEEESVSEDSEDECRLVEVKLPATTTKETIHGICIQGAESASAESTFKKLKYTSVDPMEKNTKAWDDRSYAIQGIENTPCEGGIFLRSSLHKSISKGSVTTVSMCATDESTDPTLHVFVRNDGRDGGWRKSLPEAGFTKEKVTGGFGWSANEKNTKINENFEMFTLDSVVDVELPVKAVEVKPVKAVETKPVKETKAKETKAKKPKTKVSENGAVIYQGKEAAKQIKKLKSIKGNTPIMVKFINTSKQALRISWVDYSGKLVFYGNVQPGASYEQYTYVTHPWSISKVGQYNSEGELQLVSVVNKGKKNDKFVFELEEIDGQIYGDIKKN